ncbi:MAG: hypothetical protein RLZZ214_2792 [Verrucomicrobiota bacterium]|jgi:hypothetical protein
MKIHLVTYATRRFRLRQWLLGLSARLNGVADTVTSWTPESLLAAGFEDRCTDIKLSERGSGFWAWKPFIIDAKLREVPDGDLVFYCDVGRLYPFKLLDQPVSPFVRWMNEHGQDVMPGVKIPWDGATSAWTKREALVATEMNRPEIHAAAPTQASFSIWRAGPESRELAGQWLDLCAQRPLISDDPSREGLSELPGFRGHRHDQALLTLCCLKHGLVSLDLGAQKPDIDTRHPSQVSSLSLGKVPGCPSLAGHALRAAVWPVEQIEQRVRRQVKFGKVIHE